MLELRLKNAPTCNWNIPDSWDDSTTTVVRLLVSKNMEKYEKELSAKLVCRCFHLGVLRSGFLNHQLWTCQLNEFPLELSTSPAGGRERPGRLAFPGMMSGGDARPCEETGQLVEKKQRNRGCRTLWTWCVSKYIWKFMFKIQTNSELFYNDTCLASGLCHRGRRLQKWADLVQTNWHLINLSRAFLQIFPFRWFFLGWIPPSLWTKVWIHPSRLTQFGIIHAYLQLTKVLNMDKRKQKFKQIQRHIEAEFHL